MPTKEELEEKIQQLNDLIKEKDARSKLVDEKVDLLEQELNKNKAITKPSEGPGPICEAYKVHKGEALRDFKGVAEKDENGNYISNCRSMYTKEYPYLGKKPIGKSEYPKLKAFLCAHHAHTLLGEAID